jgi:acetyl-CoA C-acetyltransferase
LAGVTARALGAYAIGQAMGRAGVPPDRVDQVFMGCVLTAGLGQNVARQAARDAGLPDAVPATTVSMVCGSGLQAVLLAVAAIQSGQAEVVVAGGMESMSRAAYALPGARQGWRMGDAVAVDTLLSDGLTDAFGNYHMGVTAEHLAERFDIGRLAQDEYAAASQAKCALAQAQGWFADEIAPVVVPAKGGPVTVGVDEAPRPGVTVESLARLKPAFKPDGTVTAGNACGVNDGAAAVVVLSAAAAAELGVPAQAGWLAGATAGVDPAYMGLGPVPAAGRALARAGLAVGDLDVVELNEAFAAQALAVIQELGLDPAVVNPGGGAIALGHPIGASGARILVTLLYHLQRRGGGRGLATLCVGGGLGVAALVETP